MGLTQGTLVMMISIKMKFVELALDRLLRWELWYGVNENVAN
jgi:hypothetical protein